MKSLMLVVIGVLGVCGLVACEQTDDLDNLASQQGFRGVEPEGIDVVPLLSCDEAMSKWNGGMGESIPGDPCNFENTCIDEYGDQMRCVDLKFVVACGITDPRQEPTFLTDGGTCSDN